MSNTNALPVTGNDAAIIAKGKELKAQGFSLAYVTAHMFSMMNSTTQRSLRDLRKEVYSYENTTPHI